MGFNYFTLLEFPIAFLLPLAVILFFVLSKNRKIYAYESVFYGIGAFLGSILCVAIAFIFTNSIILSGLSFSDDTSGLAIAGRIFAIMIAVLFVFCESFKMMTMKKFSEGDTPKKFSSLGFSAGVVIAQSGVIFVALNLFDAYEMNAGYAIFSGAILLVTGIMYTVLSFASEKALRLGSKGAAYGLSSIYYVFWIAVIFCVNSSTLMYIVCSVIYVVALILSAVFLKNSGVLLKKFRKTGE